MPASVEEDTPRHAPSVDIKGSFSVIENKMVSQNPTLDLLSNMFKGRNNMLLLCSQLISPKRPKSIALFQV